MGEFPSAATQIRAIVSARHETVRIGLRQFLSSLDGVVVVAEVAGCDDAVTVIERTRPDVAVLDCNSALEGCLRQIREIKRCSPGTHVVVVALDTTTEPAARSAGADEFLIKGCPSEQLVQAVRRVPRQESPRQETARNTRARRMEH